MSTDKYSINPVSEWNEHMNLVFQKSNQRFLLKYLITNFHTKHFIAEMDSKFNHKIPAIICNKEEIINTLVFFWVELR